MKVYETKIRTVGKGFILRFNINGVMLPSDLYIIKKRYEIILGSRESMKVKLIKNRKYKLLRLKEKKLNLEVLDASECTGGVIFGGNYFSTIELSGIVSIHRENHEYNEFLKLRYLYEFPKN